MSARSFSSTDRGQGRAALVLDVLSPVPMARGFRRDHESCRMSGSPTGAPRFVKASGLNVLPGRSWCKRAPSARPGLGRRVASNTQQVVSNGPDRASVRGEPVCSFKLRPDPALPISAGAAAWCSRRLLMARTFMSSRNTVVRSLHDLGAAAWFGGSLMGAVGVNGAAAAVRDSQDRARVAAVGWAKWTPVSAVAIGAHLIGGSAILYANRDRAKHQSGVTANTLGEDRAHRSCAGRHCVQRDSRCQDSRGRRAFRRGGDRTVIDHTR